MGFRPMGASYASADMRTGKQAQITFLTPGTYFYTIVYKGPLGGEGSPPSKGTIVVKEK